MLATILHVDEEAVEMKVEWEDYGVESVHIRRLVEQLLEQLQVEIDIGEVARRGSIAAVAEYLLDDHQEVLTAHAETALWNEPDAGSGGVALNDLAYTLQVGRGGDGGEGRLGRSGPSRIDSRPGGFPAK
ncbi:acyl carrier protein [Paenibacillus sp. P26]|nr:acyl carrier protein [Paenibacillus sp. P26]